MSNLDPESPSTSKSGDVEASTSAGGSEEPQTPTSIDLEEHLLPGPPPNFQNLQLRRQSTRGLQVTRERRLKGPLRAIRLCVLSVLLPGILVAVPLYMRFHVYGEQLYPVGISDMRLLDNRVSTTWCQRQLVRANTTFNAFLMAEQPVMEPEPLRVSMTRHLELEDDMKEYWAFYLLQGSSVTVSTCVRWPGASLVVIRGHKHLHQCAYIGDDSSEELEEMERRVEEGGQWPFTVHDPNRVKLLDEKGTAGIVSDESNKPNRMRRVRPGVQFHGNPNPISSHEKLYTTDEADSEEIDNIVIKLFQNIVKAKSKVKSKDTSVKSPPPKSTSDYSVSKESPSKTDNDSRNSTEDSLVSSTTSSEVFEDVLKRLQRLGVRGKKVLRRLNEQMGDVQPKTTDDKRNIDLDTLRSIIREMLHEEGTAYQLKKDALTRVQRSRDRRNIVLSSASLEESFNMHDEEEDAAVEEGFQPDGIADHHDTVNETTLNDRSKSEFWSSFSSSEEKLLNCAGLILNLPLTPHSKCDIRSSVTEHATAAHANTVTYKVPKNGYYFFVFNSENEVQTNYIRVHFDLEKRVYNISNPMVSCTNSTEQCALPLDFFSSEKVVLELPVSNNDTLWNEEFIAISTCEPRTALYLVCVIAVPLFILLFAFQ